MAQAAPAIMAVSTLFSAGVAVKGYMDQMDAAADAEALADKNAELIRLETEEAARRLDKEQKRTEALARARAAASGVGGQSVDAFLKDLEDENTAQLEWLKKSGLSRADIEKWRGGMAGDVARSNAWASLGNLGKIGAQAASYSW